jgi:hypothetical protein
MSAHELTNIETIHFLLYAYFARTHSYLYTTYHRTCRLSSDMSAADNTHTHTHTHTHCVCTCVCVCMYIYIRTSSFLSAPCSHTCISYYIQHFTFILCTARYENLNFISCTTYYRTCSTSSVLSAPFSRTWRTVDDAEVLQI